MGSSKSLFGATRCERVVDELAADATALTARLHGEARDQCRPASQGGSSRRNQGGFLAWRACPRTPKVSRS
jgi:hypothetical protein